MRYRVKYCTGEIVEIDEVDLHSVYVNGDKKPVWGIEKINTCDHECEFHVAQEKINSA